MYTCCLVDAQETTAEAEVTQEKAKEEEKPADPKPDEPKADDEAEAKPEEPKKQEEAKPEETKEEEAKPAGEGQQQWKMCYSIAVGHDCFVGDVLVSFAVKNVECVFLFLATFFFSVSAEEAKGDEGGD